MKSCFQVIWQGFYSVKDSDHYHKVMASIQTRRLGHVTFPKALHSKTVTSDMISINYLRSLHQRAIELIGFYGRMMLHYYFGPAVYPSDLQVLGLLGWGYLWSCEAFS